MVAFNYSTRELTTKVVYYGPGLCGKTTNLQFIHDHMPAGVRGKMLSLATKTDRTLFFDFLPLDLGQIQGMKSKVQLYTVPGQVFYNETRRLVLKGSDGVVFVADSQKGALEANLEAFRNLEENLEAHGLTLAEMPHILQYNKQDLSDALAVDVLNEKLNKYNAPFYEAIATTGVGVQETLRHITKLVLLRLSERYGAERGAGRATMIHAGAGAQNTATARPSATAASSFAAQDVPAPVSAPDEKQETLAAEPAFASGEIDLSPPAAAPAFSTEDEDILGIGLPASPSPGQTQRIRLEDFLSSPADASPPVDARRAASAAAAVSVIEVAPEDDLHQEQDLEVTRLVPGEAQDILVPLQIETADGRRCYRLVIRLEVQQ